MSRVEPGKVLNLLNETTGKVEKFRSGDVVVEIGGGTKYKIVDIAYGYVHLVSVGECKNVEENWVAVPTHRFMEDWLLVEHGDCRK